MSSSARARRWRVLELAPLPLSQPPSALTSSCMPAAKEEEESAPGAEEEAEAEAVAEELLLLLLLPAAPLPSALPALPPATLLMRLVKVVVGAGARSIMDA